MSNRTIYHIFGEMDYMRPIAIVLAILFCTAPFIKAQEVRTTVTYESNVITILSKIDTNYVIDPESGEEHIVVSKGERVHLLNDNAIYYGNEAVPPVGAASQKDIQSFIKGILGDDLTGAKLNRVNIIISEKGDVVYVHIFHNSSTDDVIAVRDRFAKVLKDTHFLPAHKDGKAVPYGVYINK